MTRHSHISKSKTFHQWNVLISRFFDFIRKSVQNIRICNLTDNSKYHESIPDLLPHLISNRFILFSSRLSIERDNVRAFFKDMHISAYAPFIQFSRVIVLALTLIGLSRLTGSGLSLTVLIERLFTLIEWFVSSWLILSNILQDSCISEARWWEEWLIFSIDDDSICSSDFKEINWFLSCKQLIFSRIAKSWRSSSPSTQKLTYEDDSIFECSCQT